MFIFLFYLSFSTIQTDRQIEISIDSSYPSSIVAETILYFAEFQQSSYQSALSIINKNIPTIFSLNSTQLSNLFTTIVNDSDVAFLQYLLDFHYFSPRLSFYTSIHDNKNLSEHQIFEFEPILSSIEYVDFAITHKIVHLPENSIIRPFFSSISSNLLLNGW